MVANVIRLEFAMTTSPLTNDENNNDGFVKRIFSPPPAGGESNTLKTKWISIITLYENTKTYRRICVQQKDMGHDQFGKGGVRGILRTGAFLW